MDWNSAIERWRVPLLGHVLELFAKIGLTEGGTVETSAEAGLPARCSASCGRRNQPCRRLIVAAARDIVVEYKPRRPASTGPKVPRKSTGEAKPRRKRRPLFWLFDPLKRVRRRFKKKRRGPEPRVRILGLRSADSRVPPVPPAGPPPAAARSGRRGEVDDGMVSARHLIRRLLAAADALQDIPRQAMRLALWQARPKEERRPERWSPLRPGRPPGFRQRAKHEVDEILKECHWLARNREPAARRHVVTVSTIRIEF